MQGGLRTLAAFADTVSDLVGPRDGHAAGAVARLRSELGLPAAAASGEPRRMLELFRLAKLLERTATLVGDPAVGLHIGERFEFGAMGALSYAVLNAPTLGTALRNLARYADAVASGGRFELERRGGEAGLWLPPLDADPIVGRQIGEAAVLIVLRMLRRLGGPGWRPLAVHFRHPAPADLAEHRRLIDAPLRFDQPADGLRFPAADLERPVAGADRFLLPIVEQQLREVVREGRAPDPWLRELEMVVASHVCDGHPCLRAIAPRLGVSVRTLQRRLDARGLCYRSLVTDVRARIARRYLAETDTPIGEIAFLLGYSELSAFDRAFRQGTGETPRAYRRRAHAAEARARATATGD